MKNRGLQSFNCLAQSHALGKRQKVDIKVEPPKPSAQ